MVVRATVVDEVDDVDDVEEDEELEDELAVLLAEVGPGTINF